ncbi:nuclear respiratory factor 1 [Holotrichia oblita]|uniref:Nuclear respiratory factor 1 n=2 Tax=Holotrichia oblita TaxID=644536 RepID=A0ACB9TA05_HOLOL|nr:nuclear respiratory factor 1 [Holotrichia oblita]
MSIQSDYSMYSTTASIEHRISSMSIAVPVKHHENPTEYAINRFSQKYDSYQGLLYRNEAHRRRLSSTGEGSGDSSTTVSGSSYGEREDGSEGREEHDELDHHHHEKDEDDNRKPLLDGQVTEVEKQQVETFFRGLKTEVFVSGSLANLYTKTMADSDWQLKFTGIPVVILDVGEARSRDKRRIQIMLAERGTCFMLWRDTIDNLTSYKVAGKAFHTMCYSSDHTLQIGFSFDTTQAAQEMWNHIEQLVACPENIQLSMPGKKKKKKEKKLAKPPPLPPKSHISQPCCFQHVTSVEQDDRDRFFSLKEFVPKSSYNSKHL